MQIEQVLGWGTSCVIILSYFWSVKTGRLTFFNWANFIGACILVPMYFAEGVAYGGFLSAFFGLVGLYGLTKEYGNKLRSRESGRASSGDVDPTL